MRIRTRIAVLVIAAAVAYAQPCKADLLGTTVTGTLNFMGLAANYFDPANGFVPMNGYGNSVGTIVMITQGGVEFGANFPANTDTVNLSASQLILRDVVLSGSRNAPFIVTLTDSAFIGLTISSVSDSFANGGTDASLDDETLTISWGGGVVSPGTMQADYNLDVGTPEPAAWTLLLTGGAMLIWRSRKMFRSGR